MISHCRATVDSSFQMHKTRYAAILLHKVPQSHGCFQQITEHRYLKVNYESAMDWKLATDYLRCNLNFHGSQRYDCVLICTHDKDGNTKHIFARLLMMFQYVLNRDHDPLDLALVQPMDAPTGNSHTIDRDLGFTRLQARPTVQSEFISLRSVVRGALLVPDFKHAGDFFLVKYVDGDWFLQAKQFNNSRSWYFWLM